MKHCANIKHIAFNVKLLKLVFIILGHLPFVRVVYMTVKHIRSIMMPIKKHDWIMA